MTRHADFEINVLLGKVPQNKVGAPDDFFKVVHNVYTTQYLEALGVEPSERYRKVVARNAPLEKCEIEATWGSDRSSAVASELRIVQPAVGRGLAAKASESESAQAQKKAEKIIQDFHGPDRKISALPPDLNLNLPKQGGTRAGTSDGNGLGEDSRELLLAAMQARDNHNSAGANPLLTEEMEQFQIRARGDEGSSQAREVLRQWGPEGAEELENLKRKFILPFACEKPGKGSGPRSGTVMVPWQHPELLPASQIQVPAEHVAEVRQPLCQTLERMHAEIEDYVQNSMPLELLSTRRDPWFFAGIRERLESMEFVRLIGLSAHLLYWTVFGHLHAPDRQLPESTRQSLVLTMQELWSCLNKTAQHKLGKIDTHAREFFVPVFILFLKRGMEQVMKYQYQKLFEDKDVGEGLNMQLVEQINVMVMNLFDPDCANGNFAALDSSMQAMKLWRKLHIIQMKLGLTPATRTLAREFRTSPTTLLLMHGDGAGPANPKTRILLQKSSSDTVLAAVAGLPPVSSEASNAESASLSLSRGAPPRQVRPFLDRHRRAALFRTACTRLSAAGQQAVSGGSAANSS
eukprot:gb/GFBE01009793.1/.p1 GENE.gb/GFBE01009793.1/~~gb/GFBE01009793.1/.p1  ORF type:complete len:576 (+),score=121.58 gb/GFBE01009793.1/:1-1728(+)